MTRLLAIGAAAMTGILVGSAMVASRFVIEQTEPASLALLRYLIGCCCLIPVTLLTTRIRFARRDWVPIALLGITQFGILIALLNYALQYISSARAALLFATMPLLTLIIAALAGYERITLNKTSGVLFSIIGVGLALGEKVSASDIPDSSFNDHWLGELAVLASALSGALCSVLYRPYLRKYPALPVSSLAMFASVLFLALLAGYEGFFNQFPRFDQAGWFAVGFIGINSGVGYFLWLWALNHAPATQVTVFLSLSPITAAALGAFCLGEEISTTFLLGLISVATGLWLAHR